MGDIVKWPHPTRLDVPAGRVLQGALDANLTDVVVCGYTPDGDFYAACSYADGGDCLWLLELCKRKLFEAAESLEEPKLSG